MINCDQTTETEQPIRHPISTLDIYFLFNVSMVRCDTISFKSLRCKSSLMSVQHNWALWQFDIGYWEHVKCRMMRSAEHLNWPSLRKSSAIECTSAVEMDSVHGGANSGYKWPSECSNGFSKRILEESLASITPYFRQASMKRAARSKCLILPRR